MWFLYIIILRKNVQVHTMLHEMLHAMGTEHEQSRSDRAGMTSMIWNNIDSNNLNNFQMGQTSNAQPYDYKSLMQYELWVCGLTVK